MSEMTEKQYNEMLRVKKVARQNMKELKTSINLMDTPKEIRHESLYKMSCEADDLKQYDLIESDTQQNIINQYEKLESLMKQARSIKKMLEHDLNNLY